MYRVTTATVDDLNYYVTRYPQLSQHATTLAALSQHGQHVRVLKHRGKVVGGYVVRSEAPFRYLQIVPPGRTLERELDLNDTVETTHVWLEKSVPTWARVLFYGVMGRDAFGTGKRWFLGGSSEERLMRQQMVALPNLLYYGPGLDGDEVRPDAWLYYGDRHEARRGIFRGIGTLVVKRARRRIRG